MWERRPTIVLNLNVTNVHVIKQKPSPPHTPLSLRRILQGESGWRMLGQ